MRPAQVEKKTNVLSCVAYKLASTVLLKIKEMDASPQGDKQEKEKEVALLTLFLTTIELSVEKHRVISLKMAVRRNLNVGNFGFTATLLHRLIELAPPQHRKPLQQQVVLCQKHNLENEMKSIPPLTKLAFCWATLKLLCLQNDNNGIDNDSDKEKQECDYCSATFSLQGNSSTQCTFCEIGTVSTN